MALKINPYSARTINNLAAVYFAEGRFDLAQEYFNRALTANPLLTMPRLGLATILLKHSEFQKAIDLCLKNLDMANNDPATLLLLVDIFIQKKDFINLKKYAYRLINSETDPVILTKLGVSMTRINAAVIALDCFSKAISIAPGYVDSYLAAGTLFKNTGKYDQAIHIWRIASSIDPSDQRFKENISNVEALMPK